MLWKQINQLNHLVKIEIGSFIVLTYESIVILNGTDVMVIVIYTQLLFKYYVTQILNYFQRMNIITRYLNYILYNDLSFEIVIILFLCYNNIDFFVTGVLIKVIFIALYCNNNEYIGIYYVNYVKVGTCNL